MKHFYVPLLAFFLASLLTGCLAVAAGAAAGSAASDGDHVEYYLKTNEVSDTTRQCMNELRVCTGMTKEQVRLVMDEQIKYKDTPTITTTGEDRARWKYKPTRVHLQVLVVSFRENTVVSHSPME